MNMSVSPVVDIGCHWRWKFGSDIHLNVILSLGYIYMHNVTNEFPPANWIQGASSLLRA